MLLPRLCWQFSQWTRQARPEQLLPSSSVSTAGLAVRSWCFPSLCHPGSKASPQELEAAQQAQAGGPDDPCVYTFPPNNPHQCAVLPGCSFHADSFVLSRMCAGISLAKTQFSWKTATQNNCSRVSLVLRHWTSGENRTSFNPLPRIIAFLELIPFSHVLLPWALPRLIRDNHVGSYRASQVQPQLKSLGQSRREGLYPPKGCVGASWVKHLLTSFSPERCTFGHSYACYHYKRAVRQQSHSTSQLCHFWFESKSSYCCLVLLGCLLFPWTTCRNIETSLKKLSQYLLKMLSSVNY